MLYITVVPPVALTEAAVTCLQALAVSQGKAPGIFLGLDVQVVFKMTVQYMNLWSFR